MLSASFSNVKTDLDLTEYYMYSPNYTNGGWYNWGSAGDPAAYPKRGSNEDLGFISRKEFNINLHGEFFDRMIGFEASFFHIDNEGLPINNSTKYPSFFSTYYPEASFVPWLNYNADRRTGFDFGVNFNKQFGEFWTSGRCDRYLLQDQGCKA